MSFDQNTLTDLSITIKRHTDVPIWSQVEASLIKLLHQEVLRPGQIIPNEATLVKYFNVSIGTVRKAVGALEKKGLLIRRQGIGTFVANHDDNSFLYKYFHILPSDGSQKLLPKVVLISFKVATASQPMCQALALRKNAKVFVIRNQLSIDNKVCMIDEIIIACAQFPLLNKEIFSKRNSTIYNLYQNRFGIFITHISEWITAIAAPKNIALNLGIKDKKPLLKIKRISYSYHDKAIELRTSYIDTQHSQYHKPA